MIDTQLALSMEFGRRFQYVPVQGSSKPRAITQSEVGRLPHSRPGAKFPYRKWIGLTLIAYF